MADEEGGRPARFDGPAADLPASFLSLADNAPAMTAVQIEQLRQLHAENVYLRGEITDLRGTGLFVGRSEAIQRALALVEQVAGTDSTVLLLGETGTGKELLATRIHEMSARRGRAMVPVNCSAIPATLMESELFGREKGAFTGALARQAGRFELADHSTIFLDEVGDLPTEVQVKLLRVLEERQVERLGSPKPIHVDVRIIAATHRNLERRVADGAFREDLFYRLNVFPIQVPPLRERVEDVPSWCGASSIIDVPGHPAVPRKRSVRLADVEKDHIRGVLEATGWRIRGAGGAADRLGLRPTTLETRMAKLGIRRPPKTS